MYIYIIYICILYMYIVIEIISSNIRFDKGSTLLFALPWLYQADTGVLQGYTFSYLVPQLQPRALRPPYLQVDMSFALSYQHKTLFR